MRTLSVREARERLTDIDELIAKEGEILLTRRGHPIARIVPLSGSRHLPSRAILRSKMPRMRTPSEALVRAERDSR